MAAESEQDDKRRAHRTYRHHLRCVLRAIPTQGDPLDAPPLPMPHDYTACDSWGWRKDGKWRVTAKDLASTPRPWRLLRK